MIVDIVIQDIEGIRRSDELRLRSDHFEHKPGRIFSVRILGMTKHFLWCHSSLKACLNDWAKVALRFGKFSCRSGDSLVQNRMSVPKGRTGAE
jgi:hypothetical protein